jgi:hypothetical protein
LYFLTSSKKNIKHHQQLPTDPLDYGWHKAISPSQSRIC